MNVDSTSQVLGWVNNHRITETRNTYQYDKGNSVTTVVTRSQEFTLIGYDVHGKSVDNDRKGLNVDLTV
jgi:hypothetical protein